MIRPYLFALVGTASALRPGPLLALRAPVRPAPCLITADAAAEAQAGEFEVSDYAGQASGLFNNMRAPASLLTGALLGATFSLSPVAGDVPWLKLLKRAPQV